MAPRRRRRSRPQRRRSRESTSEEGAESGNGPRSLRVLGAASKATVRRMSRFQYSRWDGTQVGFDLDADALLEEMTDDLLYHGDLNAALRRMMQQGFRDRQGRDVDGLRDMLERLRDRRREQLDRYDLGGVYEDIARQLDEIVDQEREGIDRRLDDARQSGDRRREELLEDLARERRQELDQLPPDLAGRVQ